MKRLNPKTGQPYKVGDRNEKGYIFLYYKINEKIKANGFFKEQWRKDSFRAAMQVRMGGYRKTAQEQNIPFNITIEYLEKIKTDQCPVFNTVFEWERFGKGRKSDDRAPSLDRIIPELGYVEGNVVWISDLANRIKSNATERELYAVADWLHNKRKEVMDAFKIKPTSIPNRNYQSSEIDSEHGVVS